MKQLLRLRRYALGLAFALLALGGAHAANAQIDHYRHSGEYEFASVGVARGQVARLHAFYHNVLPPGPCAPGEACLPPGPCTPGETCRPAASFRVTMSFYECDGSVSMRNTVELTPDRGGIIIFSPTRFNADGRACARGLITVEPDSNGYLPDLVPTVEVLDAATGQSFIHNPGTIAGFNPQPEPPGDFHFGFISIVRGQTARISASFVDQYLPPGPCRLSDLPPGPCRVTLSFYDGHGKLISQSVQTVELGKTVHLDMPTNDFPVGWRARVRASVHVETQDGELIPCIMPAIEVFDSDTGKGALYYAGRMISSVRY